MKEENDSEHIAAVYMLTALFSTAVSWIKSTDFKSDTDLHHIWAALLFLFHTEVQKQAVWNIEGFSNTSQNLCYCNEIKYSQV